MDLITNSTTFLDRLTNNTNLFRNNMKAAGFRIAGDNHPICPIMIGDARLTIEFADKMIGKYLKYIASCQLSPIHIKRLFFAYRTRNLCYWF